MTMKRNKLKDELDERLKERFREGGALEWFNFDVEPDFINEQGVKWWIDKSTTQYAREEDQYGTTLNAIGWVAETPTGSQSRVLIDEDTKAIIAESPQMEGIGVKIDLLKYMARDNVVH